jgi:pterin-4a-carbinolamine dehydratase
MCRAITAALAAPANAANRRRTVSRETLSCWVRLTSLPNFREALIFVQRVGELAEAQGHHPDVTFGWGYATMSLRTKKIKGLHENLHDRSSPSGGERWSGRPILIKFIGLEPDAGSRDHGAATVIARPGQPSNNTWP